MLMLNYMGKLLSFECYLDYIEDVDVKIPTVLFVSYACNHKFENENKENNQQNIDNLATLVEHIRDMRAQR